MIGVTTAALVALSLLPAASGAAPDPLQSTFGSVNGILDQTTASVPQLSAGGGALPQVSAGGREGGGLQLTVTPGGTATVPGTTGPTSQQPPQPQEQRTPQPQGSGAPQVGGRTGVSGGEGHTSASPSGIRSSTSPAAGHTSSKAVGGAGGGSALPGADAPPGRDTSDRVSSGSDRPSFVTRVVEEIPPIYRAALLAFGAIAVLLGLLSLYEARRTRLAQENALSDSLTGLANRQAFEQELDREWKRAARYEHDLGLLLIDLDGFKEINDTHGHIVGDRVLREAAAGIAGRVRETDFPARLGGDEFVVICPETGEDGIRTVAEGLERTLREDRIAASVGFAERRGSDEGPSAVIARADAEMYRRKRESGAAREREADPVAA